MSVIKLSGRREISFEEMLYRPYHVDMFLPLAVVDGLWKYKNNVGDDVWQTCGGGGVNNLKVQAEIQRAYDVYVSECMERIFKLQAEKL